MSINAVVTIRGLIIAIHKYPAMNPASVLRGTIEAAAAFAGWMLTFKDVPPEQLFVCASEGEFPGGVRRFGTTKAEIKNVIRALVADGAEHTSELFVFFSGHGLRVSLGEDDPGKDALVPSDFESWNYSMDLPIGIEDLQARIKLWLGGDNHFYFIDACRTEFTGELGVLGLRLQRAMKGERKLFSLYSAVSGSVAEVDSGFSDALLDGLRGNYEAAEVVDGSLCITVKKLGEFAKKKLNRDVDPEGPGPGRILDLIELAGVSLEVVVRDGAPDDVFRLELGAKGGEKRVVGFPGAGALILGLPRHFDSARLFRADEEWLRAEPAAPALLDLSRSGRIVFERRLQYIGLGSFDWRDHKRYLVTPEPLEGVRPIEPGARLARVRRTPSRDKRTRLIEMAARDPYPYERPPGGVLVLVSDDAEGPALYAGVHSSSEWVEPDVSGEFRWFLLAPGPGSRIVTVAFEKGLSRSIVTYCSEGWTTMIVVHRDARQKLTLGQVLGRSDMTKGWPSEIVRTSLAAQFAGTGWIHSADAKLEPILHLLALRDRIRDGGERARGAEDFPAFPDLAVMLDHSKPAGIPLLLENLLAAEMEEGLPMPASRLDYSMLWTCWRGIVLTESITASLQASLQ
jgi:hypothetical protein